MILNNTRKVNSFTCWNLHFQKHIVTCAIYLKFVNQRLNQLFFFFGFTNSALKKSPHHTHAQERDAVLPFVFGTFPPKEKKKTTQATKQKKQKAKDITSRREGLLELLTVTAAQSMENHKRMQMKSRNQRRNKNGNHIQINSK